MPSAVSPCTTTPGWAGSTCWSQHHPRNSSTALLVTDGPNHGGQQHLRLQRRRDNQSQIRVLGGDHNRVFKNLTYSASSSRAGIESTTASTVTANRVGPSMFANRETDLHLPSSSPAIGLGQPVYVVGVDDDGTPAAHLRTPARTNIEPRRAAQGPEGPRARSVVAHQKPGSARRRGERSPTDAAHAGFLPGADDHQRLAVSGA